MSSQGEVLLSNARILQLTRKRAAHHGGEWILLYAKVLRAIGGAR